jgi:hypothetical protein
VVIGEENDGQVAIYEMSVFDHAGADVEHHAPEVGN